MINNYREDLKPPDFSSPSRKLKKEEIEQYWAQWRDLVPPEKDRFWDGMLSGLNNYLGILQGMKLNTQINNALVVTLAYEKHVEVIRNLQKLLKPCTVSIISSYNYTFEHSPSNPSMFD